MTCDKFDACLPDLVEGELDDRARLNAEAHMNTCARCRGLVSDIAELRDEAARLPALRPSRDLWDGIAARIEAPELSISGRRSAWMPRARLGAAAALLVVTTAVVTWNVARRGEGTDVAQVNAPRAEGETVVLTSGQVAAAYDTRIDELRRLLDAKPGSLDSATMRVLAINLRVIDDAIGRVRQALDAAPSSALLSQKLQHAYELKLNTLQQFAAMSTE